MVSRTDSKPFLATEPSPLSAAPNSRPFLRTEPSPLTAVAETKPPKLRLGQMLVCSHARGEPAEKYLKMLHDVCAANNRNRGLSGVLLYGSGVFVHWLEGSNEYLDEAWAAIAKDDRHEKISVLWHSTNAPERLFGDWTMGLRSPMVARDLLEMLRCIQDLHTPKALLRANCYEAFIDALDLLKRVCAADAENGDAPVSAMSQAAKHKLLRPARKVLRAMEKTGFLPYAVQAKTTPRDIAKFSELSSLEGEASSIFKHSVPMEQKALFDMQAEGMDDLLTMLDMPLRLALGRELWGRREGLTKRPLHWTYEGKLVAVFDHKTWRVGMHPELTSVAYEQAIVTERLASANDIPMPFRITTAYALFWDYARSDQSPDVKLPSRFTSRRIRLRRKPPVPELMLQPGQQQLLTLLAKGPERLADLGQTMGLMPDAMATLLKPFYASRCIEAVEDH